MGNEIFSVKSGEFEGPLDLLLNLIEKRRLCINDVSLAEIADSFVAHVRTLESYSFERASTFISMASTLMLIKSVSLLPTFTLSREESENIEELEARMSAYQRIRALAEHVRTRFGVRRLFPRGELRVPVAPTFSPPATLSLSSLCAAVHNVMTAAPRRELRPEVHVAPALRLEDAISTLVGRVKRAMTAHFREFVGGGAERRFIIIHFLALLELTKRGVVAVHQEQDFGDIRIESGEYSVPRYGY